MQEQGLKISRENTEYLGEMTIQTQIYIYRERH